MDSMLFKHKHHYQQPNQHFNRKSYNNNNNTATSHNNNQNSIFVLNAATNNNLLNSPQLNCSDLNDNNVATRTASSSSSPSSVWSSASSNMCSPAAHVIQKLFNCTSSSLKFNPGNCSGIESKAFKSKSEILQKKSKFLKYLESESNEKNNQRGIEDAGANANVKHLQTKSLKYKSKTFVSDNQTQQDLSELLEYSCSLCDNCRCMDCQIRYFDCDNSDDSNSEYSFHLSAYDEEDDEAYGSNNENYSERPMELTFYEDCCYRNVYKQHAIRSLEIDAKLPTNCSNMELNCTKAQCCQQCCIGAIEAGKGAEGEEQLAKNQ